MVFRFLKSSQKEHSHLLLSRWFVGGTLCYTLSTCTLALTWKWKTQWNSLNWYIPTKCDYLSTKMKNKWKKKKSEITHKQSKVECIQLTKGHLCGKTLLHTWGFGLKILHPKTHQTLTETNMALNKPQHQQTTKV